MKIFKLKVFIGIVAVLFLGVFLHASVSVQVEGNPAVSQDLLLASSEFGDWKSDEFYAAVEPGHSYKLQVRAKLGDLSARVSLQPFFDLLKAAKVSQPAEASQVRRWVTGSESGHDGALNEVHYFEGMKSPWPGRFDDSGYDLVTSKPATQAMLDFNLGPQFRIPLFELVYHDCVVDYEYWGDSSNRLPDYWRFRDLLSCLYGQPQLWVLDAELWKEQQIRCVKSFQTWSPVVKHLFGQKMTHWAVVNDDPAIQETQWQDGSVVRVDFATDRLTLSGPVASAGVQP